MRKKIISLLMALSCVAVTTVDAQDTNPSEVVATEVAQEVCGDAAPAADSRLNFHGDGCGCGGKPPKS